MLKPEGVYLMKMLKKLFSYCAPIAQLYSSTSLLSWGLKVRVLLGVPLLLFLSCSSLKLMKFSRLSTPARALIHEVGPELVLALIDHNFRNGTTLARAQDSLMALYIKGDTIESQTIDSLENNLWVKASIKLCPSNLTIRQWCLIDLFKKDPHHAFQIKKMVRLLSQGGNLWLEGYSYWKYTNTFILEWLNAFEDAEIRNLVRSIDHSFEITSYKRGILSYPAPFGDLRNEALKSYPEYITDGEVGLIKIFRDNVTTIYKIYGKPVGLNTHIPIDTTIIKIVGGTPVGFKFYQGYDKKYKNQEEELLDIFNPLRVKSAKKLLEGQQ